MKALLFLAALFVAVWFWRNLRRPDQVAAKTGTPLTPQNMVSCSRCGVHVPDNEVVCGTQGHYCSVEHLHQTES